MIVDMTEKYFMEILQLTHGGRAVEAVFVFSQAMLSVSDNWQNFAHWKMSCISNFEQSILQLTRTIFLSPPFCTTKSETGQSFDLLCEYDKGNYS